MTSLSRPVRWSNIGVFLPSQRVRPRLVLRERPWSLFYSIQHTRGSRKFQSSAAPTASGGFQYEVAAAFSGKTNFFDRHKHYYLFDADTGHGSYGDPDLAKGNRKIPSGQDSFFVAPVGDYSEGGVAFAIADGVGGYKDSGIDSADFAHGICRYMKDVAVEQEGDANGHVTPLHLLQGGYERVCADPKIQGGGSTACVGVASTEGNLDVANLGDSGFVHLRLNAVSFYSDPQTHAFNTPFQLSTIPPKILAQIKNFGGSVPFCDMPTDASHSSHSLRHGDVLVFATDGVWDNLTSQEVLDVVSSQMIHSGAWTASDDQGVQVSKVLPWLTAGDIAKESGGMELPLQVRLALDITKTAKDASVNTKRDGPFARAVQQAYPQERWHGGKIDDICILVVIAVDRGALNKTNGSKA